MIPASSARASRWAAALLAGCAPDAAPLSACDGPPAGVLTPDPDGPRPQIHGQGLPDARGAWVTWTRPRDGSDAFDVWLAHLGCDGAVDQGPFDVSDTPDNDLDAALALRSDGLLVAWQADVGTAERNLRVRWRLHDPVTGEPLGPVAELDVDGNAWMPAVAATDDGYVLAVALAGATVFETHLVRLDAAGAAGVPEPVGGDPGDGDAWPAVDVTDTGEVVVAWRRGDGVWVRRGDDRPERLAHTGASPTVSAWGEDVWLGLAAPQALRLGPATPRRVAVDPPPTGASLAATDGGAFVGWYGRGEGAFGSLHVGRVDPEGRLVDRVELAPGDVPAPYPLRVTRAGPDHALVVWQEGDAKTLEVRAAFVALEP